MKTIFVSAITSALVVVSLLAFNAYAGRSAGGTYTLASPGVPFQTGQVISSSQMNNTFNDIATTLTASLDRSGNGGMLAALRGIDGTVAAPAFSWTSETNSGWYRAGTSDIRFSLANSDKLFMGTNGFGVGGAADAQSPFKITTATGNTHAKFGTSAPLYLISNSPTIGFNTYYNAGFKYGTAGFPFSIQLDGTGALNFLASATGVADAVVGAATGSWSMTNAGIFTSSGGATIGTGGTNISKSIRGTLGVAGGAVLPAACATQTITVTGAVMGAECALGYTTTVPSGLVSYCQMLSTNNCQVITCNVTAGSLTAPANTLSCRVFNP